MKRRGVVMVGAMVMCAVGAAQSAQQAQSNQQPPPALHQKDRPLERLVSPGQSTLVVEKDQSPPLIVQPPAGTRPLEWLAGLSELVLIVRVDTIVPSLTPSRDWIESTVHGTIEQILKSKFRTMSPGESFRFTQDGGELVLRGTKVSAALPYADLFQPRQRYLVFADSTEEDGAYRVEPLLSFRIDERDVRLTPLAHEGMALRERDLSLDAAVKRIVAALERPR